MGKGYQLQGWKVARTDAALARYLTGTADGVTGEMAGRA